MARCEVSPFSTLNPGGPAQAPWGSPSGEVSIGATEGEGTEDAATRADHVHATPAAASGDGASTSLPGDAEADGTATTPARSDHVHAREQASAVAVLPTNPPVPGDVYANTADVPLAVMVGVALTASSSAEATVSVGSGPSSTPTTQVVGSISTDAVAGTVPVTILVAAGDNWVIAVDSPGAAAVVGTALAVLL